MSRGIGHDCGVEISFSHQSAATAQETFTELSDLGSYPNWMSVVQRATPVSGEDSAPTWDVTLTGSIGKLRRSKRIRMARTEFVPNRLIVFERREIDQRTHSIWALRVEISEKPDVTSASAEPGPSSLVQVQLHYGGRLWDSLVERMLRAEVEESKLRLEERLLGVA